MLQFLELAKFIHNQRPIAKFFAVAFPEAMSYAPASCSCPDDAAPKLGQLLNEPAAVAEPGPGDPGDQLLPVVVNSSNSSCSLALLVKQKRLERRQASREAMKADQVLQLALQSAQPNSFSPLVEPLLSHHVFQYSDYSDLDPGPNPGNGHGSGPKNLGIAIQPSVEDAAVPISPCVPGCRAAASLDLAIVSMTAAWKDTLNLVQLTLISY